MVAGSISSSASPSGSAGSSGSTGSSGSDSSTACSDSAGKLKKCASRRGNDANVSSQITSWKAQLRDPLSPLQTAWTGFDPYLYSGG